MTAQRAVAPPRCGSSLGGVQVHYAGAGANPPVGGAPLSNSRRATDVGEGDQDGCRHEASATAAVDPGVGAKKAPGSAVDGAARMDLSDGPAGATQMDWSADIHIHGRLASVGARLIEGTSRKLIAQTFDCMRAKLEA